MPARRITRGAALAAIRSTADAAGVDAARLTPAAYRLFRSAHPVASGLPSEMTIGLLFGGWHRACAHAAEQPAPLDADEGRVRDELYGGERTLVWQPGEGRRSSPAS